MPLVRFLHGVVRFMLMFLKRLKKWKLYELGIVCRFGRIGTPLGVQRLFRRHKVLLPIILATDTKTQYKKKCYRGGKEKSSCAKYNCISPLNGLL